MYSKDLIKMRQLQNKNMINVSFHVSIGDK